jgi:hypothetical protein
VFYFVFFCSSFLLVSDRFIFFCLRNHLSNFSFDFREKIVSIFYFDSMPIRLFSKNGHHSPPSYSKPHQIQSQINRKQNRVISRSIEYLRAPMNGNLIRSECFDFGFVFIFHQIGLTTQTSPGMFLDMTFKSWVDIQDSIFNIGFEYWIIHYPGLFDQQKEYFIRKLIMAKEIDLSKSFIPFSLQWGEWFNKSEDVKSIFILLSMNFSLFDLLDRLDARFSWNWMDEIMCQTFSSFYRHATVNNFKLSVIIRISDLAHVQEIFSISINRLRSILGSYLITWNKDLRKIGYGFWAGILALFEYCSQASRCRIDNRKKVWFDDIFVEFQS